MARLGRRRAQTGSTILVVCTGNVCRSPYIAAQLRTALPGLRVASAGTGALTGEAPTPEVARRLADFGIDVADERATPLTAQSVRRAALIITAERAHRLRVGELDPSARGRAFTVKELARVLGAEPVTGLPGIVARATAAARDESVDHDDDLADPYGLDGAAYEQMFAETDAALREIVPALRERPPA